MVGKLLYTRICATLGCNCHGSLTNSGECQFPLQCCRYSSIMQLSSSTILNCIISISTPTVSTFVIFSLVCDSRLDGISR